MGSRAKLSKANNVKAAVTPTSGNAAPLWPCCHGAPVCATTLRVPQGQGQPCIWDGEATTATQAAKCALDTLC